MEGQVCVDMSVINDLRSLMIEIQDRIESLTLIGDEEFVESYVKAKEEIKNGELGDFDEL
ncbi:MAG: hypothetical protein KJ592_01625 [Nanoarchaeota archaeon]|nr:hypothetical protein [Nanoarchaeota archaeon]